MFFNLLRYIFWQSYEKPKTLEDYIYTLFCWFIVMFWEFVLYIISLNFKGEYLIFVIFPMFFAINVLFSGVVLKIKDEAFSINFVSIGLFGLYYAIKHIMNTENNYV